MRTSCIDHSNSRFIALQLDYMSITGGDHCAALLLHIFETWHNYKVAAASEGLDDVPLDFYKTVPEEALYQRHSYRRLSENMMGMFSDKHIVRATRKLVEMGFIKIVDGVDTDRTKRYLFLVESVQKSLDSLKFSQSEKIPNAIGKNGVLQSEKIPNAIGKNSECIYKETIYKKHSSYEDKEKISLRRDTKKKERSISGQGNKTSEVRIEADKILEQLMAEAEHFGYTWDLWVAYRKEEKRKPITPRAEIMQLRQLLEWHNEGYEVVGIINKSIMNSYTGLFKSEELKKSGDKNYGHTKSDQYRKRNDLLRDSQKEWESAKQPDIDSSRPNIEVPNE